MLDLWRRSERPPKIARNRIISLGRPKKAPMKGMATEHIMDAKETKPDARKIAIHDKAMMPITQEKLGMIIPKAIRAPRLVAIPLPPLKPRKIVQLWPATTAIAVRHR